jgi:hypothetical protein
MTFEYTDPTGERLYFRPAVVNAHQPTEAVALETETGRPVYFAADQLEDVIAGLRDIRRQAARTASGQQPEPTAVCHPEAYAAECPCPPNGTCCKVASADPTIADDPTPLRWGLGDVLWGDDDTVIVCLSGPDREPYWLELDAERAAALRDDLAAPAVGQPAEAQAADEVCPPHEQWRIQVYDADKWNSLTGPMASIESAEARCSSIDMPARIVRETTTWTVEDER